MGLYVNQATVKPIHLSSQAAKQPTANQPTKHPTNQPTKQPSNQIDHHNHLFILIKHIEGLEQADRRTLDRQTYIHTNR